MRLIRAIPREHDKRDFTRMQHLDTFVLRDELATRWNYTRHGYEVAVLNPSISESQLETSQVLLMLPNTFCQKEIFRNHLWDDKSTSVQRLTLG